MEAVLTGNGRQGNNRLRTPKRLFAPTQTIVRLYANRTQDFVRGCKEGAYLLKGMHFNSTTNQERFQSLNRDRGICLYLSFLTIEVGINIKNDGQNAIF